MRLLLLCLVVLTLLMQYPLWWGKGGWLQVWDLEKAITVQHEANQALAARNAALAAEVQDLQSGTEALEERARSEMGMIRAGEIFVQILDTDPTAPATHTPAPRE